MPETYNSVLDRIGAFNAATENMTKGRAREVRITAAKTGCGLRLVKTPENYSIEVTGAPDSAAEDLAAFRLKPAAEAFARPISKAERSWDVASDIEDILQDGLKLGPDVSVTIETIN